MNWRSFFKTGAPSPDAAGFRLPGLRFLAINVLALLALYGLIVQPLRDAMTSGEDSLAERRTTAARYEAIVAQTDAIRAYAKQVAAGNARGEFIPGENEGIVAANLQARLKAAAEQANVSVRSLQMLPSRNVQDVTLLGARLEVAGPLPAIHALARNLEGDAPLLLISDANLRSQLLFGAAADRDLEIEAQFDVLGAAAPRPAQ